METVQRVLLVMFAAFAGLTIFQQLRYGMICGRTEQADKQEDPKARACRQRAVVYAVCAAAPQYYLSFLRFLALK